MKYSIFPLLWTFALIGCQANENSMTNQPNAITKTEESKKYIQRKEKGRK
jgi:uncharacterized lipoprotein YajG